MRHIAGRNVVARSPAIPGFAQDCLLEMFLNSHSLSCWLPNKDTVTNVSDDITYILFDPDLIIRSIGRHDLSSLKDDGYFSHRERIKSVTSSRD